MEILNKRSKFILAILNVRGFDKLPNTLYYLKYLPLNLDLIVDLAKRSLDISFQRASARFWNNEGIF